MSHARERADTAADAGRDRIGRCGPGARSGGGDPPGRPVARPALRPHRRGAARLGRRRTHPARASHCVGRPVPGRRGARSVDHVADGRPADHRLARCCRGRRHPGRDRSGARRRVGRRSPRPRCPAPACRPRSDAPRSSPSAASPCSRWPCPGWWPSTSTAARTPTATATRSRPSPIGPRPRHGGWRDAAAHHDAAAAADEGHGHDDDAAEPVTSLSDPRVTDEQRDRRTGPDRPDRRRHGPLQHRRVGQRRRLLLDRRRQHGLRALREPGPHGRRDRARPRPHRVDRLPGPPRRHPSARLGHVHPRRRFHDGRRARHRRRADDVARPPEPVLGRRPGRRRAGRGRRLHQRDVPPDGADAARLDAPPSVRTVRRHRGGPRRRVRARSRRPCGSLDHDRSGARPPTRSPPRRRVPRRARPGRVLRRCRRDDGRNGPGRRR